MESDTSVKRIIGVDNDYRFSIKIIGGSQKRLNKAKLKIVSDEQQTEILSKDYSIDYEEPILGELTGDKAEQVELKFYVVIKKDAVLAGNKKLVLKVEIEDSTGKAIPNFENATTRMTINITGDNRLNGYNYLAYVGTNFDLVDGIKAKNFFFANTIYLPPLTSYRIRQPRISKNREDRGLQKIGKDRIKSIGIYMSLYGNRTLSSTDSLTNISRVSGTASSGDTAIVKYIENVSALRKRVSDNIGATFSPLIRIGEPSSLENTIKCYYAPSFELIWRRIEMSTFYSQGTPSDTIYQPMTGPFTGNYTAQDEMTINYNEFDVNLGMLGIFITHETNEISVRVAASMGLQLNYTPENVSAGIGPSLSGGVYKTNPNMFFAGRAWVTDADSGITLQAEITNTVVNSKPYYGVTLSKAINYKKLGDLFSPLTSR
jgi:hypothetical protein